MSEKAISFTTAEWEALAGLPYMQRALYMVLRWYMSVATRRVGDVRGISLQSLGEELYIEPAPGRSESGSPTKKAVRNALEQLEKHGLVRPCGNGENLVFFLPKAGDISAREKTKGHKRGTVSGHTMGHSETPVHQWFSDEIGHVMGHTQNPAKGHTSEVRVNHPYTEASAAACAASVDKSDLLVMPLQAERVAEWIRLQELKRGCRARVTSRAPLIAAWVDELAVTGEELHEAYRLAKIDREVTQNRAAIHLPFLDIFVRRVVAGRRVSSEGAAKRVVPDWWQSAATIAAKAKELGIEPEPGEPTERLRSRVVTALLRREAAGSERGGELCPI